MKEENIMVINLKELTPEQKNIIKYINKQILEHQQVFQAQPEEILISEKDFNTLSFLEEPTYLLLGKIKIYKI